MNNSFDYSEDMATNVECKTEVFAMASSLTNLTTLDEDQLLNVHVFSSLYCWLFYLYQAKPE